ncbi:hypothetical protein FOA52_007867 [Chlamydomonas sp. UWO 241]|nr:hypothetical protein FOA52_007867 [Chlamydomonas sp. UWO 241]
MGSLSDVRVLRSNGAHARSLMLVVLALATGAARAGNDNGGPCTFPYCGCFTEMPDCVSVSEPVLDGQNYSFTISATCAQPLGHGCAQDIKKIEFNSFAACRWSRVTAEYTWNGNTVQVANPTFDKQQVDCEGVPTILKLNKLDIKYAMLVTAPVTITLKLNQIPGIRRCPTYPLLLNRTLGVEPFALFSSDLGCCPVAPTPPPALASAVLPPLPGCEICRVFCAVDDSSGEAPPAPTDETCEALVAFQEGATPGQAFSCVPSGVRCVEACATGAPASLNASCEAQSDVGTTMALFEALGYTNYACTPGALSTEIATTCGCQHTDVSIDCSTLSPPPPSPPAAPACGVCRVFCVVDDGSGELPPLPTADTCAALAAFQTSASLMYECVETFDSYCIEVCAAGDPAPANAACEAEGTQDYALAMWAAIGYAEHACAPGLWTETATTCGCEHAYLSDAC